MLLRSAIRAVQQRGYSNAQLRLQLARHYSQGFNIPGMQAPEKGEALKQYVSPLLADCNVELINQSVDLTEMARNGKLDPTIGRDEGKPSSRTVHSSQL